MAYAAALAAPSVISSPPIRSVQKRKNEQKLTKKLGKKSGKSGTNPQGSSSLVSVNHNHKQSAVRIAHQSQVQGPDSGDNPAPEPLVLSGGRDGGAPSRLALALGRMNETVGAN